MRDFCFVEALDVSFCLDSLSRMLCTLAAYASAAAINGLDDPGPPESIPAQGVERRTRVRIGTALLRRGCSRPKFWTLPTQEILSVSGLLRPPGITTGGKPLAEWGKRQAATR
jgi:hypothetical protein